MSESIFKINNITMINTWSYDLKTNYDCTICRQPLNSFSIYAKEKNINNHKIIFGFCGHGFHEECIKPWTQINNKCPICSKTWNECDSFSTCNILSN